MVEGTVTQVSFSFGVELLVGDGASVRLEGPGTIRDSDSMDQAFDPESPSDSAPVLVQFLHREVQISLEGSTLIMTSDDGMLLRVPPSDDYEAWSISHSDGSRVVCAVGGEITRWQSE